MDENLYAPPEDPYLAHEGRAEGAFGEFRFGSALSLSFRSIGPSPPRALRMLTYFMLESFFQFGSLIIFCGLLFAAPHFAASASLLGLRMIRGNFAFEDMFLAFRSYASILGYSCLNLLGAILLGFLPALTLCLFLIPGLSLNLLERAPDQFLALFFLGGEEVGLFGAGPLLFMTAYLPYFYLSGRAYLIIPLMVERRLDLFRAFYVSWRVTAAAPIAILLYSLTGRFFLLLGWSFLILFPTLLYLYVIEDVGVFLGILFNPPAHFFFMLYYLLKGAGWFQLLGQSEMV